MCTVIIATRVWSELPLLVASNRDEALARPSLPPSRWRDGMVAPRDERAGGTWIGVSDVEVVAAVTNRFGPTADPARRSRGELVPMALEAPSAEEAARRIARISPATYNPFHLLV
ncbi:MAG: NRDE family protein, partial [Myxococcota bacterium]|nr:NRDE family protein [Myxococcota bacterium]